MLPLPLWQPKSIGQGKWAVSTWPLLAKLAALASLHRKGGTCFTELVSLWLQGIFYVGKNILEMLISGFPQSRNHGTFTAVQLGKNRRPLEWPGPHVHLLEFELHLEECVEECGKNKLQSSGYTHVLALGQVLSTSCLCRIKGLLLISASIHSWRK